MNAPITSSAAVSSTISIERIGSRPPPVSVTTVRMRWRERSRSWWRSGRRTSSSSRWRTRACGTTTVRAPQQVDPPAQVDVVAVERDRRVEPAERPEQVGTHEQAGRRQGEDVADGVVLLLVVLAGLGDRIDLAETVETQADVLEDAGIVPGDELGAHRAGVRAVQLLDEQPDRVVVEHDVVVAEAEETAFTFDEPQHFVGGRSEAGIRAELADERLGQPIEDAPADVGGVGVRADARGQQEERVEIGVILGGERGEDLVEPGSRAVDNDDGDHRGRERGVGFHGGARLSVRPVGKPAPDLGQVVTGACNS